MIRDTFEIEIDFSAKGNGGLFANGGWSRPEPNYSFNYGSESRLVLPKPFDSDSYELTLDVWPFVVLDRLPTQRIDVLVRGCLVMSEVVENRQPRTLACAIPPPSVDGCTAVDVTFRFPNATAPAGLIDRSRDTRPVAFAFRRICFAGRL